MAKMYHEDGRVEVYQNPRTEHNRSSSANHRDSSQFRTTRPQSGSFNQRYSNQERAHANVGEFTRYDFNVTIGTVLSYGFFMSYMICKYMTGFFASINPIVLTIGYIACVIIGGLLSAKSDNPLISFLGYNLVVLPVGAVLSVCLAGVNPDLIMRVATVTAGVTSIMLVAAIAFPDIFRGKGRILLLALTAVIIMEIFCAIIGVFMPELWDVLVAGLFALYIGYNWAVAQEYDCTIDNAIDACVGLYLNIVNLFLRVLSVMERHDY